MLSKSMREGSSLSNIRVRGGIVVKTNRLAQDMFIGALRMGLTGPIIGLREREIIFIGTLICVAPNRYQPTVNVDCNDAVNTSARAKLIHTLRSPVMSKILKTATA